MNTDCDPVDDLIESIAAGDLTPNGVVAEHLATCQRCQARLHLARRLDAVLTTTDTPPVSDQFVSAVFRRLRGEWWRTEQHLDRWFNAVIALSLMLVIAGIWMLLNRSGLSAVAADASGLLATGIRALTERLMPSLPLYGAATLILIATFGVWWWAERGSVT